MENKSPHPADALEEQQLQSGPEIALEQKLLLKIDARVLPILFCLFLISFIDRSNLANARIEGLERSLHMDPKSNGYNMALSAFIIPYILFEVPSNIILKKVRPAFWLSGIMFCWGWYQCSINAMTLYQCLNLLIY